MSEKLISIVVPVYNVSKYLEACITSIRNQTYKNLQIILVDDGSTDGSGDICDKYRDADNRIEVIHKVNEGLSEARNTGIKNVRGDYFIFIDSDDYIHSQMIEILYKTIEKNNADIALCKRVEIDVCMENFTEKSKVFTDSQIEGVDNEQILNGRESFGELYKENSVDFIVAWNKLYDKKMVDKIHFPKGKIHEDEFTIPIVLYNASRIVYKKLPLYYYVRHNGSITKSGFSLKNLELEEALSDRINFYKKENLKEYMGKGVHHFIGQGLYDISKMGKEYKKEKKILLKRVTKLYIRYFFIISHRRRDCKNIVKEWIKL